MLGEGSQSALQAPAIYYRTILFKHLNIIPGKSIQEPRMEAYALQSLTHYLYIVIASSDNRMFLAWENGVASGSAVAKILRGFHHAHRHVVLDGDDFPGFWTRDLMFRSEIQAPRVPSTFARTGYEIPASQCKSVHCCRSMDEGLMCIRSDPGIQPHGKIETW